MRKTLAALVTGGLMLSSVLYAEERKTVWYGCYSEQQFDSLEGTEKARVYTYLSPKGQEVWVTEVSNRRGCPGSPFKDMEDRGEVTKHIRSLR